MDGFCTCWCSQWYCRCCFPKHIPKHIAIPSLPFQPLCRKWGLEFLVTKQRCLKEVMWTLMHPVRFHSSICISSHPLILTFPFWVTRIISACSLYFVFNGRIIALQCFVTFFCTTMWFSCMYTYISSLLSLLLPACSEMTFSPTKNPLKFLVLLRTSAVFDGAPVEDLGLWGMSWKWEHRNCWLSIPLWVVQRPYTNPRALGKPF